MASLFRWFVKDIPLALSSSNGGQCQRKFGHGITFAIALTVAAVSAGICYLFSFCSSAKSVDLCETNDVRTENLPSTSTEDIEEMVRLSSQMDDYGRLTNKESVKELVLVDGLANNLPKKMEEPETITLEVSKIENIESQLITVVSDLHVASKYKAKFNYVKAVLEISGFSRNTSLGTWWSDGQAVDPSVYEEMESCLVVDPERCGDGNELGGKVDRLLLFHLINEVLMGIYSRSLSSVSHICPMPSGPHVQTKVWALISWYLSFSQELDQSLKHVVASNLAKPDGWMNLQLDAECIGLELEDLIFDDLLEELFRA